MVEYEEEIEVVVLGDDDLEMVYELKHLREERRSIEKREAELRKDILARLDGAQHALTASGRPVVKVRIQSRRGVDSKQLEAMYPDVYEAVMTESDVTILDLP